MTNDSTITKIILKKVYQSPVKRVFDSLHLTRRLEWLYGYFKLKTTKHPVDVRIGELHAKFETQYPGNITIIIPPIDEAGTILDIESEVENDTVFYDLGASIGLYTCLLGSCGSVRKVISFEPAPKVADELRHNIELNDVDADVFQNPITNTNEETEYILTERVAGGSLNASSTRTVTRKSRTLDSVIKGKEIAPPDILKLDIEGAELNALRGMSAILSKYKPLLYIEVHPVALADRGQTEEELLDFARQLGYTHEVLHQGQKRYIIKLTQNS